MFLPIAGEVQREMLQSVSGSQQEEVQDEPEPLISGHMLQAVFSMLWSTVVIELWKRRSSSLSYQWGTLNLAERFAEPRPGFHGDLGVNPVTGRVEPLFPEWKRDLRIALVSVPVVGLFLGTLPNNNQSVSQLLQVSDIRVAFHPAGLVVLGMMCFYWAEARVQWLHKDWNSMISQTFLYVPSVLHIVYTNMLANLYRTVANSLTEYGEMHEENISGRRNVLMQISINLGRRHVLEMVYYNLFCLKNSNCNIFLREPQRGVCLRQPSDRQNLSG